MKSQAPLPEPQTARDVFSFFKEALKIYWAILFFPDRWNEYVRASSLDLATDFSLLDLRMQQLRNPLLWRFLLKIALIPILVAVISLPLAGWINLVLLILVLLSLILSISGAVIFSGMTVAGLMVIWVSNLTIYLSSGSAAKDSPALLIGWAVAFSLTSGAAGFLFAESINNSNIQTPVSLIKKMIGILVCILPAYHFRATLDSLSIFPFSAILTALAWAGAKKWLEWESQLGFKVAIALFVLGPVFFNGEYYYTVLQYYSSWLFFVFILAKSIANPKIGALAGGLAIGIWMGSQPFHKLEWSIALQRKVWSLSTEGLLIAALGSAAGLGLAWGIKKFVALRSADQDKPG